MAKKINYNALDDIGFVGVDIESSPRQHMRQVKETAAFIRNFQAGKVRNASSSRTQPSRVMAKASHHLKVLSPPVSVLYQA